MVSQFLKDYSLGKSSNTYRNYIKLETDLTNSKNILDKFSSINFNLDLIKSPCIVSTKVGDSSKVVLEYYTGGDELITSLVISTIDKYSSMDLYEFFRYLFSLHNDSDEELLKEIWTFSCSLAGADILSSDSIVESNKELVRKLVDIINHRLPIKTRDIITDPKEIDVKNCVFCKSISLYSSRNLENSSIVNYGNLCNGLFEVKQGKYDSEIISDTNYEEIGIMINSKLKQSMIYNEILSYSSENSIYYSITLLEYINEIIRR